MNFAVLKPMNGKNVSSFTTEIAFSPCLAPLNDIGRAEYIISVAQVYYLKSASRENDDNGII